ncbi:hypothetical protein PFISCL1PPCAC_3435, partial [Pristionchus fissidentatus]
VLRARINESSTQEFDQIIHKLTNMNETSIDLILSILHGITSSAAFNRYSKDICFIEIRNNGEEYSLSSLVSTATELALDLQKIILFTSACTNATEKGDALSIEMQMNKTAETIEGIADHMEMWNNVVQSFLQRVTANFAKRALGSISDPDIETDEYNKTAMIILLKFTSIGPQNICYQVLVTSAGSTNEYFSEVHWTRHSTYSNITNFRGITAHIYQHTMDTTRCESEKMDR